MARSWFFPGRATEASPEQLVLSGAIGGYGVDPVDGDIGYRQTGQSRREIPSWSLEKMRAYSVAAYRINPMANAIIDTYTSFCVGDSGVSLHCSNDDVDRVARAFWDDPAVNLGGIQEMLFRDHLLMGETILELMVGPSTGVMRISPIDPTSIQSVSLRAGNPLWFDLLEVGMTEGPNRYLSIVRTSDVSGLRSGEVMYWPSWRALVSDRRGMPFLSTVLDQLDAYDLVLNNLVDRTALARYLVWDVTLKGAQTDVDDFVKKRGGMHVPRSGSIEVHNESVEWKPQTVDTGSFEDTNTLASLLTNIASGAGLAKTWLADPAGANRATSLTMAEPVRRRVGGVQKMWLGYMTELVRMAVDRAVAAGTLPAEVDSTMAGGALRKVAAAQTVTVSGPEIAAADSQITAQVLLNLSQALQGFVSTGVLSKEAGAIAAQKAWEQFVGQPFRFDLAVDPLDAMANADPNNLADQIDDAATSAADGGFDNG